MKSSGGSGRDSAFGVEGLVSLDVKVVGEMVGCRIAGSIRARFGSVGGVGIL